MSTPIPNQIQLPLSAAMDIVMQGFRIRFGRSLVTVFGVLLGIAFLMSTLATFLVKQGVREEDRLRTETRRMGNFLQAEVGTIRDRAFAISAPSGDISDIERLLVAWLAKEGAQPIVWLDAAPIPPALASLASIKKAATPSEIPKDTKGILILGEGAPSVDLLKQLANRETPPLLAFTRALPDAPTESAGAPLRRVALGGKISASEQQRLDAERRASRARVVWIVIIALLVTIMGISNAILMSVTERFREIGTMKCLGADSRFIRRVFLIESSLIGAAGGLAGAVLGAVFSYLFHCAIYGIGLVSASLSLPGLLLCLLASVAASVLLSILAAIYPASVASSMVPSDALRSNI